MTATSTTTATLAITGTGLTATNISIQRYPIVTNGLSNLATASQPQTGWWWNASQGGRGYFLEVQNNTLFFAAYMYDTSGKPIWYLTQNPLTTNTSYAGLLTQYANGQTLGGVFKSANVSNSNIGSITINFPTTTTAQLTLPNSPAISMVRYSFGTASTGFSLTSTVAAEGGTLSDDYICDGTGSSPALSWSNPPAGTKEYALLMSTLPGDGTTKYNWVLYSIPVGINSLAKNTFGIGTNGPGSDGAAQAYQPPCSQGPGAKQYTFKLYALSGSPSVSSDSSKVTGDVLTSAISSLTLGTATLNLNATRTTNTASTTNCLNVRNSLTASTTGVAQASCDATYAYVSSTGIATHTMMNGIVATNLQVPTKQNFLGANGWKIPLNPAIAATTTAAVDGPIGIIINGVPIFNPCKQGGCTNGDTKALGELDICNGHAGRADDYHYHAAPTCVMAGKTSNYWDTHPVGWALDGYAIFGYNDATGSVASRDSICGGNTSSVQNAPSGYSYHVTDTSPYVLSCFRGSPSPDLAGQGAKYSPMRQPPVTPFAVSNMTLSTDATDGYQVLQFTSGVAFTTTETGTDSYANKAGTYKIRYTQVSGSALVALLALNENKNKTACWTFQFVDSTAATTQPTVSYCR